LEEQRELFGFDGSVVADIMTKYQGPKGTVQWATWLSEDLRPNLHFRTIIADGMKRDRKYLATVMRRLLRSADPASSDLAWNFGIFSPENRPRVAGAFGLSSETLEFFINYVLEKPQNANPPPPTFRLPAESRPFRGWGDACDHLQPSR
jgi:hypothetical protein